MLYFSAERRGSGHTIHCVGTATSGTVAGPYIPSEQIFVCPEPYGGAIDASGYRDVDGTRWVIYKIDGNARGSGGDCGNGVMNAAQRSTPIMLQRVAGDGISKIGGPVQVLDREALDGPLVEAPSISRINGLYFLFFSSNCFYTDWYDTTWAVSNSLFGPYQKKGPLFTTGSWGGLVAPGGADVSPDGHFIAFHAGKVGSRAMYTARLGFSGAVVSACASNAGDCVSAARYVEN